MSGTVGGFKKGSGVVGFPSNPAQPYFRVKADGQANMAINATVVLTGAVEVNVGGLWTSDDLLLAPVTGRYLMQCTAVLQNVDQNATAAGVHLETNGTPAPSADYHTQTWQRMSQYSGDPNLTWFTSHVVDLPAGAYARWYWHETVSSGTQSDLHADTYFTGCLLA